MCTRGCAHHLPSSLKRPYLYSYQDRLLQVSTSNGSTENGRQALPELNAGPVSADWARSSQTVGSSEILAPVREDMEQMAVNLRNIVGDRHPLLLAAADQIFGAGGKKLRPAIVFLVARATAELMGLRWAQVHAVASLLRTR